MNDTPVPSPLAAAETTIQFLRPVMFAGIEYPSAVVREPTASQWSALDGLDGVEANRMAIVTVCGLAPPVVDQMGARDFRSLARAFDTYFAEQSDDPEGAELVIPLRAPVAFDGKELTELRLHEPSVADMRTWEGFSGTTADIKAVAAITGESEILVGRIGIRDLRRAAKWIGHFFVDAPATGAVS